MRSWIRLVVLAMGLFITVSAQAEIMNVLVAKEIDDDHIIIITAKGDQLLLEKWTMKLSPLLFEGKIFPADISSMWAKIYIEGKGEIEWSIEKHLGTVDLEKPKQPQQRSKPKLSSGEGYEIEVAHNDELFIINGEKFEAQTYCLGWEEGERVLFIEGSAFGACASAQLLNINRSETCDVWCE